MTKRGALSAKMTKDAELGLKTLFKKKIVHFVENR